MSPEEKKSIIGSHALMLVGMMLVPTIVMVVMDTLDPGEPTASKVAFVTSLVMLPVYIAAIMSLSGRLDKFVK